MKDGTNRILKVVVGADISADEKMELIKILIDADQKSTETTESEPTFTVKPKRMLTTTAKKRTKHNLSWAHSDRVRLFERMVEVWGPFSSWTGEVTPGTNMFKAELEMLGNEFGRTPGAIKAQMLSAISKTPTNKNIAATKKSIEAATIAGFVKA
jgi:hypothetical protein